MRFLKMLSIQLVTKGQCRGENPKSCAQMDFNFSVASFPLENQSLGGPCCDPSAWEAVEAGPLGSRTAWVTQLVPG